MHYSKFISYEQRKKLQPFFDILHNYSQQKNYLSSSISCGIMDEVGVANELTMINKKEIELKEKILQSIHITNAGNLRSISYVSSKGLWQTKMPDGKKLYGKTREILVNKLFEEYGLSLIDTSVANIFKLALDEKARCENNNPKTISHLESEYRRFISDDFAGKNLVNLTGIDLKEYTQTLVQTTTLTKKAFFAYKGVLNLIFNYAMDHKIISENPVKAIKNRLYYKSCDVSHRKADDNIFSDAEIEEIKSTVRKRMSHVKYNGYFINGYAILFAIETGTRVAEICSLKWSDIHEDYIHIHSQQLGDDTDKERGSTRYYYADWTKNEKGISEGGREFPLTDNIRSILYELKSLQETKGIESEFVFCHEDGEWIKTDAYLTCLRRLCQSLGYKVTNNHAFRKSLNSNVFIPLGIPETERARLLGHSVETNIRFYSYAKKDSNSSILELLNNRNLA